MIKYTIYPNNKIQFEKLKEKIESISSQFFYTNYKENNYDYIFVFGGDGTFVKALKENYNKNIKCILINRGLNGFLSSVEKINNSILANDNYSCFDFLIINNFICINEAIIEFQQITKTEAFIDKYFFKNFLCSKILIVNNIGTTGLARSYRYPLILRSNSQYIIDFLEEPLYHYYKPLNQPLILSNFENTFLKINSKKNFNIKIDNINTKIKTNEIIISMHKSKMKVLNFQDKNSFFEKINTLF